MGDENDDIRPVKNRGIIRVGALFGVLGLLWAGWWTKKNFVDPDRMLVGVHALSHDEAIAMYRYDGNDDDTVFRIARIRIDQDAPLWELDVSFPSTAAVGNGMSAAGQHVVILEDLGNAQAKVAAHDIATGEVAWERVLDVDDGSSPALMGRTRFALVDGKNHLYVLDRESGKTLYEREGYTQNINFAFSDSWLEIEDSFALDYLDIDSGRVDHVEGTAGAHCRVDNVAYGFDRERRLLSRDLRSGEEVALASAEALLGTQDAKDFRPQSCGWQRRSDGTLRLIYAQERPASLVAIDVKPSAEPSATRPAWTYDSFPALRTGQIDYRVQNRLDLVWSGEMPRFAPLQVRVADSGTDSQLVVFDTETGSPARTGAPNNTLAGRFTAFSRAGLVFMVSGDPMGDLSQATVLSMDGSTGEAHAVQGIDLSIEPTSVVEGAVWTWTRRGFSREGNLPTTVLGPDLQNLGTSDPDRAPTQSDDAVASLLGRSDA